MAAVFHRLEEQTLLRNRLDLFLERAAASPTARQIAALVVSELFTNAIEHGEADEVRISVDVGDHIVVVVSHPSSTGVPVRIDRSMPPVTSERGRGLAIVDRLTRRVRTEVVGGWHRTEAVLVGEA